MATPGQLQSEEPAQRARRILDQDHEWLNAITRRILQSASDGRVLAAALEDLNTALVEHFTHEEHPHGLEAVLGDRPTGERQAYEEILAEHESILSNVEELVSQARDGKAPPAGLAARASMLARFLADHERREDVLLKADRAGRPAPAP